MALIDRIPMPEDPGSSFFSGATNTQNILSKILEGRQNQQKIAQDALNEQHMNKYRMGALDVSRGNLGIARMAEQRAQQLMPYLTQQYKDTHNKSASDFELQKIKNKIAKYTYDEAIKQVNEEKRKQLMQQAGQQVGGQPGMQPGQQAQSQISQPQEAQQAPQQSLEELMSPLFNQNYTLRHTAPITPEETLGNKLNTPGMQVGMPPEIQQMMQAKQAPQIQQAQPMPMGQPEGNIQTPGNVQQPGVVGSANVSGAAPNPDDMAKSKTGYKAGDEIVIKKGRPGFELQDKLVGTPLGEKAVTKEMANGWIYTQYPSGKVTAVQNPYAAKDAGETPEQKRAAELQGKKEFSEFEHKQKQQDKKLELEEKATTKTNEKITDTTKTLIPYMRTIQTLSNIVNKKKLQTGRGTQAVNWLGLTSDPDVGVFNSGALKLQQGMVKDFSTRGGYGLAKIVAGGKPGIQKSPKENEGIVKEMKANSAYSYIELKKDFEKHNPGQDFDVDLQDIYPTLDTESPDGKLSRHPTNEALRLIKDHPNYKIVG